MAASSSREEEKVSFESKAGKKLVAILTDTGSEDAAVLCHGLGSNKNGFHMPALARELASKGLSSLRLDFSGCGESEGPFRYANHHEEADEIQAAIGFLKGRGKKAVATLGHSKGGSSVLLHSATFGNVAKVVNISGRFNHKEGMVQRFGEDLFERIERDGAIPVTWNLPERGKVTWSLEKQDVEERMGMDMAAVCARIPRKVQVLTIHGTEDATIPVQDARSFAALLPGNRIFELEGCDHNFTKAEHSSCMIQLVVDFLTA